MTDISVQYYTTSWQDLTPYCRNFKVEENGIKRTTEGTVTLFGKASDLSSFLTNPYRLVRIRIKPSTTWQNIFYGYVDNPFHKAVLGMLIDMRVISLDLFGWEQRLATDYITFDYYKLQSAITPLSDSNAWTYRKMIEDFVAHPDSTRDGTGLSGITMDLIADEDSNGIDHIIDSSCSWSTHTLFEAIRIVCARIGYDGYYLMTDALERKLYLYPYDKSSSGYLYAPYVKEPEYEGGSLNDIGNVIFVWGGIDAGVPADGDRWTEYGYGKYSPKAWSASANLGNVTISDTSNANLGVYGVNAKSVKFLCDSNNAYKLEAILDITKTAEASIDCLNRCADLQFAFYPAVGANMAWIIVSLIDSSNNRIDYACLRQGATQNYALFPSNTPQAVYIPVKTNIEPTLQISFFFDAVEMGNDSKAQQYGNKWYYHTGSTTFDWEHVEKAYFTLGKFGGSTVSSWSLELDGIIFIGGMKIKPFEEYSETLNPPAKDQTSINQYDIHPYPQNDTQISSFEQAQAEGARILANLKNPIPRLTLTKLAPTTQYHPSNVVTISGVDYRITKMTYEWASKKKECHVTYKVIGKTNPLPPIWTEQNELRYLVK